MSGDLRHFQNKDNKAVALLNETKKISNDNSLSDWMVRHGCSIMLVAKRYQSGRPLSLDAENIYTIGLLHYLMKSQEDYTIYVIT